MNIPKVSVTDGTLEVNLVNVGEGGIVASDPVAHGQPVLQGESNDIVARIRAIVIGDQDTYDSVVALGRACRAVQKRIEEFYAPHKANAHKAWKDICNAENRDKELAEAGYKEAKSKAGAWEAEVARIRREAERKAAEEARRRAEEEALAAAQAVEAAGGSKAEVTAAIEEAVQQVEFAHIVAGAYAAAAVPQFDRAKSFTRSDLEIEVTDLRALIADVAARPDLSHLLNPNMTAIKAQAKSQGTLFKVRGVTVREVRK